MKIYKINALWFITKRFRLKSITPCRPLTAYPFDNQLKNKTNQVGYPTLYPRSSSDLVKLLKNIKIKFLLKTNILVHHYSNTEFRFVSTQCLLKRFADINFCIYLIISMAILIEISCSFRASSNSLSL